MTNNKLSVTLSSQLVSQINSGYAARTLEDDTVTLSRYIQEILSHWYFMRSDKSASQVVTSGVVGATRAQGTAAQLPTQPVIMAPKTLTEKPKAKSISQIAQEAIAAKTPEPVPEEEEPPFDKSKCQHEERYSAPNDEPGMDYCAQCSLLVPKETK